MILLLGGTTEAPVIADSLVQAGLDVLVSSMTQAPGEAEDRPGVEYRTGSLDPSGMLALVKERAIASIVDATHPYASQVTETALGVCSELGIPYYRFDRPGGSHDDQHIVAEPNHRAAAKRACSLGSVVLLTIGSRNLEPYVEECRRLGCELYVRVLPCDESLVKCRHLGIVESHVIAARGPFSVEENEAVIAEYGIAVLVTKDSGDAGGVPEKMAAAKNHDCSVVLVERPTSGQEGLVYNTVSELVTAVTDAQACPLRIGTTSFIIRDDILPNVRFLADKVDDVELLVFESDEQSPLPGEQVVEELGSLAERHGLSYTVHLPLDAWIGSEDESVRVRSVEKHRRVISRFEPIGPRGYVLHCRLNDPVSDLDKWQKRVGRSLDGILYGGMAPQRLCAEILEYPFDWIEPVVRARGVSICMDLGHVIAAGGNVEDCMDRYLGCTSVVHLHGVEEGGDHRSLSKIAPAMRAAILSRLLNDTTRSRILTLEVFDRAAFEESLVLLEEHLI